MVRQDIVAGLRNAIERGTSLENAKQTMYNSGYSKEDVTEAANYLTGGLGDRPLENLSQNIGNETPELVQSPTAQTLQNKKLMQFNNTPNGITPEKKSPVMLIVLIAILLLLVGILIVSLLFKDNLISFFQGLFS